MAAFPVPLCTPALAALSPRLVLAAASRRLVIGGLLLVIFMSHGAFARSTHRPFVASSKNDTSLPHKLADDPADAADDVSAGGKPKKSPEEGDYGGYGWGSAGAAAPGAEASDGLFSEYALDEVHPGPPNIECFTCHYSRWKGYTQGMAGCDDPFSPEGIPTVLCEGLCAKTRTQIGTKEYMVVRSCLPNCKDSADGASRVECCYGTKCNGKKHTALPLIAANVSIGFLVFMLGFVFTCVL